LYGKAKDTCTFARKTLKGRIGDLELLESFRNLFQTSRTELHSLMTADLATAEVVQTLFDGKQIGIEAMKS
jgi:hypothetical protein